VGIFKIDRMNVRCIGWASVCLSNFSVEAPTGSSWGDGGVK